jgi:hypothetical protein
VAPEIHSVDAPIEAASKETTQFISAPDISSASNSGVSTADYEAEGGNIEESNTDHPPVVVENESKRDGLPGSGLSYPCQMFDLLKRLSLLKVMSPHLRLSWSPRYPPPTHR